MISCDKDENPITEQQPEQEFYTVQLGWSGEILDISYEPLTRSEPTDDIYGIQVYYAPNNEVGSGENGTWTPYAYGIFCNADNISINLLVGYKYKFVATMIVDGKNKLQYSSGYFMPFELNDRTIYAKQTNTFEYRTDLYFTRLGNGLSYLKSPDGTYKVHNIERYYGELDGYIPGDNGNLAKIHMKRTSFGAKFIANGKLANNGTLQILINGAPEMNIDLSANKKQISDIFTFSNVYAAWEDNKYSETISVNVNWNRVDGTVLPLGSHEITYKRNATTVVNINIENDGEESGIGFEIDENELGDMLEDPNTETTITDGEIVDTEIDSNGGNNSEQNTESSYKSIVPQDEIWYTYDGPTVDIELDMSPDIISHTYENGKGIIKYSKNVTTIGTLFLNTSAFVLSIFLPEGVTSIGSYAFLQPYIYIDLPTTITHIGSKPFPTADMLNITCRSLTPPILEDSLTESDNETSISIRVPSNAITTYKTEWSQYAEYISGF